MAFTRPQSQQTISKKRRRGQQHMQQIDEKEKRLSGNDVCINELPDHLLIYILSRTGIKEAARTSVLARRWRYLWKFAHGILRFGNRSSGEFMKRENFDSWVNTVLKTHKAKHVEGVVIELEEQCELYWIARVVRDIYRFDSKMYDRWVYFAMRKQVGRFELNLLYCDMYKFPSVASLISRSHGVSCRLRTFRLINVEIDDKVVHYILASCSNLEELSINKSLLIANLQVIDPPSLKVLKIINCFGLEKLVISAATLVSLTFTGVEETLYMKKVPNLREISLLNSISASLIQFPERHHFYSNQLEKIVMDFRFGDYVSLCLYPIPPLDHLRSLKRLEVFAVPGATLLVFTLLLKKACPQLREFRIEISYSDCSLNLGSDLLGFLPPALPKSSCMDFVHMDLKLVEIGGYRGGRGEEELVLGLIKTCPSIERVVIDTQIDYFYLPSYNLREKFHQRVLPPAFFERQTEGARNRAKERAKGRFASKIPQQIKFVVI